MYPKNSNMIIIIGVVILWIIKLYSPDIFNNAMWVFVWVLLGLILVFMDLYITRFINEKKILEENFPKYYSLQKSLGIHSKYFMKIALSCVVFYLLIDGTIRDKMFISMVLIWYFLVVFQYGYWFKINGYYNDES